MIVDRGGMVVVTHDPPADYRPPGESSGAFSFGIEEEVIMSMKSGFPRDGVELTTLLVVSDIEQSRTFYRDVLGATVYREYGGTSCVLNFQGAWLLLVTGGGPTEDKPDVTFAPPANSSNVTHELTIRVPDCREAYEILRSRGAGFLTPPHDNGYEVRCFFRDPDGHLLEISEVVMK